MASSDIFGIRNWAHHYYQTCSHLRSSAVISNIWQSYRNTVIT